MKTNHEPWRPGAVRVSALTTFDPPFLTSIDPPSGAPTFASGFSEALTPLLET
jgi:hypothetical protein